MDLASGTDAIAAVIQNNPGHFPQSHQSASMNGMAGVMLRLLAKHLGYRERMPKLVI